MPPKVELFSTAAGAASATPAGPVQRRTPPSLPTLQRDVLAPHPQAPQSSCFLLVWIFALWTYLCRFFSSSNPSVPPVEAPAAPVAPLPTRRVVLFSIAHPRLEFCLRERTGETEILGLCLPGTEQSPSEADLQRVTVDQFAIWVGLAIQRHGRQAGGRLFVRSPSNKFFSAFYRAGFVIENDPGLCPKYEEGWIGFRTHIIGNLNNIAGLNRIAIGHLIDARAVLAIERGEDIPEGSVTVAHFHDIKQHWYRDGRYPQSPTYQAALAARLAANCPVSDLVEGRTFVYTQVDSKIGRGRRQSPGGGLS